MSSSSPFRHSAGARAFPKLRRCSHVPEAGKEEEKGIKREEWKAQGEWEGGEEEERWSEGAEQLSSDLSEFTLSHHNDLLTIY